MKKGVSFIIVVLLLTVMLGGCELNITSSTSEHINDFSGEGNDSRMLNIPEDDWKLYYEHEGEGDFKIGLHDSEPVGMLDTRVWDREEAEEWLENEGYETDRYAKTYNFHAFTQEDEDEFDVFEMDESPFYFETADGVHANRGWDIVYYEDEGKVRENMRIQSIRFYHGEGEDILEDIVVGKHGSISGSYYHPASGEFYISIVADGDWTIKLMDVN